MLLLDHDKARKSLTDAFATESTRGGVKIPLRYELVQESADSLTMLLQPDAENNQQQSLVIHWGPHRLTTSIRAKL